MARTASMTPQEALDAATKEVGMRGTSKILSSTRGAVRRWLVAEGIASSYVQTLSLDSLNGVWNDISDSTLGAMKVMARNAASSSDEDDDTATLEDQEDLGTSDGNECAFAKNPNGIGWVVRSPISLVQGHLAEVKKRDGSIVTVRIMERVEMSDGHYFYQFMRLSDDDQAASASQATQSPRAKTGHGVGADKAAAKLAEALAAFADLGNSGGNVDEAKVREIVRGEVKTAIKDGLGIYQIEIKTPDRPEIKTDPKPHHEAFPEVLAACAAGMNVLLVGPAGCGKTHLAEEVAKTLGREFRFSGAVASEYKLLGFIDAHGRTVETEYRRAYENGAVFLWDEMDASAPGAMLAFNAGLANGHQDFPDKTVPRHKDFIAIASANTYGHGADRQYVGRNQLDAASLDRFYVVPMGYDEKLERALYGDDDWIGYVHSARRAVKSLSIRHVVSMRAIDMGQKMLAAGVSRKNVERAVLWKHLADADITKIRGAM